MKLHFALECSFSCNEFPGKNIPGSPVLGSDGKVIGVMNASNGIIVADHGAQSYSLVKKIFNSAEPIVEDRENNDSDNSGTFKFVTMKNRICSRLDRDVNWLPAKKIGFFVAGSAIYEAKYTQKEFIPLLNFWFQNPYKVVSDNIKISDKMRKWVTSNNKNLDIYRAEINMKSSRSGNRAELCKIRTSCIKRAKAFYNYPSAQSAKVNSSWETGFIRKKASLYEKNWHIILDLLDVRIESMLYKMPNKYK